METHKPEIQVEGPSATHTQGCAVRHGEPAVLDMNEWVFQPSWAAQEEGWRLVHAKSWWQRTLLKWVSTA